MSISIKNIDVFILSYNREQFLVKTIESLFNQTVKPSKITIFDNGSSKNLIEKIKNLDDERIILKTTNKNKAVNWNYTRAIKEAKADYTVLFHDDDIIHFQFLEHVIKAINKFPGIGLICSGMLQSKIPESLKMKNFKTKFKLYQNSLGLMEMAYWGFHINFSSSVYYTPFIKQTQFRINEYQKISDRPFMFEIAKYNGVVILPAPYIYYRVHEFQDSNTNETGPFKNHIINLHKLYYKEFSKGGILSKFIFYSNFKYHLKKEYKNLKNQNFKGYKTMVTNSLKLSSKELFIIDFLYSLKIFNIFKLYRLINRTFFQYS